MTYENYIKNDYKIKDVHAAAGRSFITKHLFSCIFITAVFFASVVFFAVSSLPSPANIVISENATTSVPQAQETSLPTETNASKTLELVEIHNPGEFQKSHPEQFTISELNIVAEKNKTPIPEEKPYWKSVRVKSGDNLALIFKRERLSPQILYDIMAFDKDTDILKRLQPEQELRFLLEDGQFRALQYDIDLTDTLYVKKSGDVYSAEILEAKLHTIVKTASSTINDSLFLAGRNSGLSDNMTMQLIRLYGWDIDFALEVRKGDQFHVIYEEQYKDSEKVREGPILAAEFINRGKSFKSVRYTDADGLPDYYAENGNSMRKAFIRTPVEFSRISSHFNLRRKHPILNKIRAHKGVDYAAPSGTPIKSAGNGIVKLATRKGGYGKTIIVQHGGQYTTLYSHLSHYAQGIKKGKHVKQGQIIGYVGKTGLATGPHLHYEFRINGVHRNPLTVKLPKAERIPDNLMDEFKTQAAPLLAQLNSISDSTTFANHENQESATLALNEKKKSSPLPN